MYTERKTGTKPRNGNSEEMKNNTIQMNHYIEYGYLN